MKVKPLSPQRAKFAATYLRTHNATASAIAAGFSKKSARALGSRILGQLRIAGAIPPADDGLDDDEVALDPDVEQPARGPGQPPILPTPELTARFCEAIRHGCFKQQAARLVKISPSTFERWRKKGAAGIEPYRNFCEEFEQAELELEKKLTKLFLDATPNDWRAAKELLARRFPQRWSDHAGRLAVMGPDAARAAFGPIFSINIHLTPQPGWAANQQRPVVEEGPADVVETTSTPALPDKDRDPDPSLN